MNATTCYFCPAHLSAEEMRRGNVCVRCSRQRNGVAPSPPSRSAAFLAAHPDAQAFAAAFRSKVARPWTGEEAMRFNARRMREKHRVEAESGRIRLDRLHT